jgi:hypothetical protein
MKLYTEEDLIKAIAFGFGVCRKEDRAPFNTEMREFINSLTPIELPSDEELKKQFDVDEFDPYDVAYLGGAMRMRNLIQGGNK